MAAFQWFTDLLVKGGRLQGDQVNLNGQSEAETEAFSIKAIFGLGIQMAQSWIATTSGTLYNQGNGEVKSDGALSLRGNTVNVNGQMTVNNGLKFSDGTTLNTTPFVTVANYAALPASVTATTFYYVQADEQNPDSGGTAQPSLYILTGTTKLWSPLTPV